MANRSYLYTYHPTEAPAYRDFAEWKSFPPIAHLLLVGADPTVCSSAIWDVDEKIAIKGEAPQTRPLFLAFLDWLEPQLPEDFRQASEKAKVLLTRADRQGTSFHLELGEIYDLMGFNLDEMERETSDIASDAGKLFEQVRRLVESPGSGLKDAPDARLRKLADTWEEQLGLSFSDVLYFHFGG